MHKKYYIFGLRPVIEEVHEKYSTFYAFQWETGEFAEDMTYLRKIYFDMHNESTQLEKEEFDAYLADLKRKRNL